MQQINYAGNALAGFQQGQKMRSELETKKALSGAMQGDPRALQELARWNPQMAMQLQEKLAEQQKKARVGQLAPLAAQGDSRAIVALWADDPELAFKLDKRQADKAVEGFKFIGQAAYDIIQRPEHERPVLWDQYIERGIQMGFDTLAQYRGKYDPVALNSVVAKAEGMKSFMEFQQPSYKPDQGYGFQGFQFGRPIEGGSVQQPITPGAIVDDPRKGGSGGNAGGGFPY